ncbi:hypothetical protein HWV62_10667 [Athelia sp. TMB]|nr:hypothetical protein HWV62_4315 [Athelia sp. TMB]KAF7975031.1 hypothetical protein HWV62_10667 [Athelia sp. TMB]
MEDTIVDIPESPRRSKRIKMEERGITDLEDVQEDEKSAKNVKSAAKSSSPRKPKVIKQTLATPHAAPPKWRETYATIKEMRSKITAPVDTMGCDRAQLKESEPKNQRFATLVSLMLSSQTKDEVTDAAVTKLREAVGGTLSVDAMIAANDAAIEEAICKVGFWRRKAQYLKRTAEDLRDKFQSDVPQTVNELCSLPGVGPKMAFLALQVAWNM